MSDARLFPDLPEPLEPAANRPDPTVWIRRLRVLDRFSPDAEVVREVTFRRGLNIIRTAVREASDDRTVGHSVGKTLLCRLIRFALGEPRFCTRAVRERIATKLPEAYVVADLVVDGQNWVTARPIGVDNIARQSRSLQGEDWLSLHEDGKHAFSDFTDAVTAATTSRLASIQLARDRSIEWLDLLGWLTRDQSCRYRHHNEWRDAESESGSPALTRENASFVIRAAMGLLDAEEIEAREHHEQLRADHRRLEREINRLTNYLDVTGQQLTTELLLEPDVADGPLFAEQAQAAVDERLDELNGNDDEPDTTLNDLEETRREADEAVGAARSAVKVIEGILDQARLQLEQAENADADTFAATFAQQVSWCQTFQTEQQARASGCQWQGQQLKPGERDPRQELTIAELKQQIAHETSQLPEAQQHLDDALDAQTQAADAVHGHINEQRKAEQEIRREVIRLESLRTQAQRYRQNWDLLETHQQSAETRQQEIDNSLETQRDIRQQITQRRETLSGHFDRTLKALAGSTAGGQIAIDGRGIFPRPNDAVGAAGEAMGTSTTVLGFDLACLAASISGLGHHPRFLIHDSPREADMEQAMYDAIFRLAVELESIFEGRPPSFQYVVTTTTPPPDDLPVDDAVRLNIDGRSDDSLLLRQRF